MPSQLPIYYDLPAHSYSIGLDGETFEFRFVFRERRRSWYLDIRDEDGNDIVLGRRLSPSWSPDKDVALEGPAGLLVAVGPDPYPRDGVTLWYYTTAELAGLEITEDELLVVVSP